MRKISLIILLTSTIWSTAFADCDSYEDCMSAKTDKSRFLNSDGTWVQNGTK